MPYPDHEEGTTSSRFFLFLILFNVWLLLNILIGLVIPGYKDTGVYKFFTEMIKTTDNSPSCRYDQDCDYVD